VFCPEDSGRQVTSDTCNKPWDSRRIVPLKKSKGLLTLGPFFSFLRHMNQGNGNGSTCKLSSGISRPPKKARNLLALFLPSEFHGRLGQWQVRGTFERERVLSVTTQRKSARKSLASVVPITAQRRRQAVATLNRARLTLKCTSADTRPKLGLSHFLFRKNFPLLPHNQGFLNPSRIQTAFPFTLSFIFPFEVLLVLRKDRRRLSPSNTCETRQQKSTA